MQILVAVCFGSSEEKEIIKVVVDWVSNCLGDYPLQIKSPRLRDKIWAEAWERGYTYSTWRTASSVRTIRTLLGAQHV